MIHRALLGSMERFFGILIEHYAGAFPVWMAPVQAKILPILEKHHPYALDVEKRLKEMGVRAETDMRNEKIGYKIREAQLEKAPYMLVIGDRELESGQVAVRSRKEGDLGSMDAEAFIERITKEIKTRAN